jgi:hypothetical protein
MRRRTKPLVMLAVSLVFLFVACGESKEKAEQRAAANNALKALRKVEAATQVGVNFQQYGQLVIDAKAQVNEASSKLPDGELKKELNSAVEAYSDANQVWNEKIGGRVTMSPDTSPGKILIPKYSLKTETYSGGLFPHANLDDAMQAMWGEAKKHLDKAASLIDSKK